jgi:hypothetical protein
MSLDKILHGRSRGYRNWLKLQVLLKVRFISGHGTKGRNLILKKVI